MNASAVSSDEKRKALQEVLQSVTFRRAEQLRLLLQYIVEEEIEGRGSQIREWDIAVRALNRPADYTPETDSTVRTRAHALRQRLAEYYDIEASGAEIRIELPKGGYTPRFVRAADERRLVGSSMREPEVTAPAPSEVRPERRLPWASLAAGGALGVLCTVTVGLVVYRAISSAAGERSVSVELQEAWAPILQSSRPVKIIMSSPYQFWVRDYRNQPVPLVDPVDTPPMPDDPRLLRSYSENVPLLPDSKLYLHGNAAGALWGDAAGVQVATRFLAESGVRTEFVPEKSLKSGYVFRNDSYLAFGRSEYSTLMAGKIPPNGYDVIYIPEIRRHGIALRADPARGPKFLPTAGSPAVNYGLITIIRDKADDGHPCQAMLFAGVISNGAQAAIEYMTTPRHVNALMDKLRASSIRNWPKVLQVIVRSETTEYYPIRTEYETHLVLQQ